MKSISTRIILNNIMNAVLIICLMGFVGFNWGSEQIKSSSNDLFQMNVQNYGNEINRTLDWVVFVSDSMKKNILESYVDKDITIDQFEKTSEQLTYFNQEILDDVIPINNIHIAIRSKDNLGRLDYFVTETHYEDSDLKNSVSNHQSKESFEKSLLLKGYLKSHFIGRESGAWSDIYIENDREIMTYYEGIRLKGELIGIISFDVDINYFEELVRKITINKSGYGIIFDKNYVYLSHPELKGQKLEKIEDGQYINVVEEMEEFDEGVMTVSYKGVKKKIAFLRLKNDWVLALVVPISEIYDPIWDLIWNYVLIISIFLIAIVIAAYKSGKALTKPIIEMRFAISKLEKGNYTIKLPNYLTKYSHEVGILALEVNKMVDKIGLDMIEIKDQNEKLMTEISEREKVEAELSLNSKILSKAREGMFIVDEEFLVLYVNDAFVKITGFSRAKVVGRALKYSNLNYDYQKEVNMYETLMANGAWKGEIWQRRKGGQEYLQHIGITRIEDESGIKYIGIFEDATELDQAEQNIDYLRNYDSITGLPRKHIFINELENLLEKNEKADESLWFNLVFVGLDNFRIVNEVMGHSKGDQVLAVIGGRLEKLRNQVSLSRISGDEFAMLVINENYQDFMNWIKEAQNEIKKPIEVDNKGITINSSMGISVYPLDGNQSDDLIRKAQTAMNFVKSNGKNNFKFYSEKIESNSTDRLEMANYLRMALQNDEFVLYYQPIVEIDSEKIVGLEALIRWFQPKKGMISPNDFIPLAEDMGMIKEIGEWVLAQACRDGKKFNEIDPNIYIAVNIAANQFEDDEILKTVVLLCDKYDFNLKNLELEITERMLVKDNEYAVYILEELKKLGVLVSIDDFGTGYSSLSYLKDFQVDKLKIDKSFVDLIEGNDNSDIVSVIIQLAKGLELSTIAEGIETKNQAEFLKNQNCEFGQGYYYSRPIEFDKMIKLLKDKE